ncbi:hypothetical protein AAG570_001079 [Ranatra chinensis]|uniref:Uncharacterized protein n=1 Tax=Ranatra chinensis TaxID=642074 RepID=A0ABD0YTE5_9HEMI
MKNCKNPIRLLRNIATKDNSDNSWQLCEFGRLVCWRDGLLVSHSADSVVIIDPIRVTVVATLRVSANHNICSLAATPNELFLICGARDLLRVSYTPDINGNSIGSIGIVATGEAVSSIPRFTPSPVTGTVLDMNFKAPTSKLSASIPESVICASEVTYGRDTTLPPVVVLHDGVTELRVDQSRFIQLNAIGEEAFDEIIYVPDVKVLKICSVYILFCEQIYRLYTRTQTRILFKVKKKNGLTREQTSEGKMRPKNDFFCIFWLTEFY